MATRKITRAAARRVSQKTNRPLEVTRDERKLITTMRIGAKAAAQRKADEAAQAKAEKVFPLSRKDLVEWLRKVRSSVDTATEGCIVVSRVLEHEKTQELEGVDTVLRRCVSHALSDAWSDIDELVTLIESNGTVSQP